MAVLDIRVLGDPILRTRTAPTPAVTEAVRALVADMFETMYAAEGIGLAAPQVFSVISLFVPLRRIVRQRGSEHQAQILG